MAPTPKADEGERLHLVLLTGCDKTLRFVAVREGMQNVCRVSQRCSCEREGAECVQG
jgi:hypothetical protein